MSRHVGPEYRSNSIINSGDVGRLHNKHRSVEYEHEPAGSSSKNGLSRALHDGNDEPVQSMGDSAAEKLGYRFASPPPPPHPLFGHGQSQGRKDERSEDRVANLLSEFTLAGGEDVEDAEEEVAENEFKQNGEEMAPATFVDGPHQAGAGAIGPIPLARSQTEQSIVRASAQALAQQRLSELQQLEEQNAQPPSRYSRRRCFILPDAAFEVEPRYTIEEVIGHGAYGVVTSGRDLRTESVVAIKKIEHVFDHRSLAKRTLRELKFLRMFRHENVMPLYRVMIPKNRHFSNIYMVCELLETDLACVIRSPQELSDEHVQFFTYQLLRGVKYMHSANVVHRDLKPRNLLVNSNCDMKICDFGLARFDDPRHPDGVHMSDYVATRWYRAPEIILSRSRYTKAIDIWSVGCILAELLGRKPLFPGRDSFHQITLIVSVLGTPKNYHEKKFLHSLPSKPKIPFTRLFPRANPLACDLLDRLLQFYPEDRPTAEDALKHPYLAELHCEEDEPICDTFAHDEFEFENHPCTKEELRDLIHSEIVDNYHVEDGFLDDVEIEEQAHDSQLLNFSLAHHKLKRKPKRRKSL